MAPLRLQRVAFAAICLLVCLFAVPASAAGVGDDMYCGAQDCYKVLGVEPSSTLSQVKKAYYKLALELHPDKNPDPAALERYRDVTTAYEVLGDVESRAAYDEALRHPEQFWRNRMRYYSHQYRQKQIPVWAVVTPLFLLASIAHYYYWSSRYHKLRVLLRQSPLVQTRMRQKVKADLTAERQAAGDRKAAEPSRAEIEARMELEDVGQYAELRSWEGRHPTWRDTLPVWLALAPLRLSRGIAWYTRYFVLYSVLQRPLSVDSPDADYATCSALQLAYGRWRSLEAERRAELVQQQLWIPKNLESFKRKQMAPKKKTW